MGKILGLLGAAIAPPVAAFAFLQTWAKAHPVQAVLLLLAYEAVVWGTGLVGRLVGGTADELRDLWKNPLARRIDEGVRRRVSRFYRDYRHSLRRSLRHIDTKGLATMGFYAPRLDEVFIDLSLVYNDPSLVSSGVLGQRHVDPVRRFIGNLIDKPDPVLLAVIGAPGCGKTTLLRHTALLVLTKRRRRRPVPVLLYLRDHIQAITGGAALPDLIHRDAPAGWFERKLRSGSCVVLLDGLDEVAVAENRLAVADWVEEQVTRYPSNDFVITSRPHGYQSAPISGASVAQVRSFTDDQVTKFVRTWYLAYVAFEQRGTDMKPSELARRATEAADDLLERLRHNPGLYELTVNPLLLTMIANVHKFRGALPGSRVELYSEICQVLLWRRQAVKKLGSELSNDQKITLLGSLAFWMMSRQLRDISREQLEIEFHSLLRRMTRDVRVGDFLAEMTSNGLLLERERDLFAFAHLTFQEYLAAQHIREKRLTQVLIDNVDDAWWRETTLLHAARSNADPIVQKCLDSGTVHATSLAIDCADVANELGSDLRSALDVLSVTAFESTADVQIRTLMVHVMLSQHLRRVVRTDESTRLCVEPITARLYQFFLESHPNRVPDGPIGKPDEPVRGVRLEDANAFVKWVNDRAVAEQTYRLPSASELESLPQSPALDPLIPWTANSTESARVVFGPPVALPAVYEDLPNDLVLLPEVEEAMRLLLNSFTSNTPLRLPDQPQRRALKLRQVPVTAHNRQDAVGWALADASASMVRDSSTSHAERIHNTFINQGFNPRSVSVASTFELVEAIGSVRGIQLSGWGATVLPGFVEAAGAVTARTERLTAELAAELRLAAMCLSFEKDHPGVRAAFQRIAVGMSFLQRRADGRLPANETIVLATD